MIEEEHCEAIFTGIRDSSNTRLWHLMIYDEYGLNKVFADLLAEAAMKLETLEVEHDQDPHQQGG